MALHPVGPLPPSTYWRRRALMLLAVVVVLVAGRACVGGGDPQPTGATPGPTASPTPTPTARPTTAAPASGAPCPDSALKLETTTDEKTYPLGGTPTITLTLRNTSGVACTRDMGAGAVELQVFSGDERIWSSDDCSTGRGTSVVTLAPGAAGKVVTLTWAGKRSKPQCAGTKDRAKVGTYRVVGRVGTLRAEGAVFHFRDS